MPLNPYLGFDGNCAEAFRFYERSLGGKIEMTMTYGETPMADQTPPEARERIAHVRMALAGGTLMGSDAPPGQYHAMQGCHVSLIVDTPSEADRIFAALAEAGAIQMPIQETFWATRFGMLVDRFGIAWMVNCEKAA